MLVERLENIGDVNDVFFKRSAEHDDVVEVNQAEVGSRPANDVAHASLERRRRILQTRR